MKHQAIEKQIRTKILNKIGFVLCLLSLSLHVNTYASSNYASKKTFTFEVEHSSLKTILRLIQSDSDFAIVYNSADVKGIDDITLSCDECSTADLLDKCLSGTNLDYDIKNKTIVIYPKETKATRINKIHGLISDESGHPIAFATVCFKDSNDGCIATSDGFYELDVPPGKGHMVIVVQSLGYADKEIKIDKEKIDITLIKSSVSIDEVVVTGYQTLSRERATGSFSVLDESVLDNKISVDFVSRLEGNVPGLQVDKYGGITIRGTSTLNASTQPLVVVDGFPIEGDYNTVNPNDIKSISILKDAAAASIWGARASNGVIVITSKQSPKGTKPHINVSYNITSKARMNFDTYRYASPADQIEAEMEAIQVGNYTLPNKKDDPESIAPIANFILHSDHYYEGITGHPYDYLSATEIAYIEGLKTENGVREFEDHFIRRALSHQANVSVNGATDKVNYYITGIFDQERSDMKREGMRRAVINSRLNIKLSDRISLNSSVLFSKEREENNYIDSYQSINKPRYAYGKYKDENGNYNAFPSNIADEFKDQYKTNENYTNWLYNPLQDYDNSEAYRYSSNYRIQTGLDFKLLDGLDFTIKYQYESYNNNSEMLYGEDAYTPRNAYNTHTGYDNDTQEYIHSFPLGELLEYADNQLASNNIRTQLNFNKSINNHVITAITGWEYRAVSAKETGDSYVGYNSQILQSTQANWKDINNFDIPTWNGNPYSDLGYTYEGPNFTENEERYVSFYANAGYTFEDKYDLTLSGRIDDSNLFGADRAYRIHPFWSAGAGWAISNEGFFDSNIIDHLKVRATYGLNGNIDRSTVPQMKARITRDGYSQDLAAVIENPGNDKLRWEETRVSNLGIDYGLLNNRVSGYVEIYYKDSKDLLGQAHLHPITGYQKVAKNVANVRNRGIEFVINTTPLQQDDYSWDIGFSIDYNHNAIYKVYQSYFDMFFALYEPIYRIDKPIGGIYAFDWAYLGNDGLPVMYNKAGEEVTYFDNIGKNIDELRLVGPSMAPVNSSINTTFRYKNLTLSMLFMGHFGHYFRMPLASLYSNSGTDIASIETQYRWRQAGDELHTQVPKIMNATDHSEMDFYNYADLRVKPADYITFQELSLSYELSREKHKSLPLNNLTLMAYLTNLGKWVKNDEGIDPETVSEIYMPEMLAPIRFTVSLGLKATF